MSEHVTIFPCGMCGRTVGCPCLSGGDYIRAEAAVERRHKQAVARARRKPAAAPVRDATTAGNGPQRAVHPQQRAQPGRPTLDDWVTAVVAKRRAA